MEEQEQHYDEDNVYKSLQLLADYEKSYKTYEASQPDHDLAKKEANEKFAKEVLVKQLKDEEALQTGGYSCCQG